MSRSRSSKGRQQGARSRSKYREDGADDDLFEEVSVSPFDRLDQVWACETIEKQRELVGLLFGIDDGPQVCIESITLDDAFSHLVFARETGFNNEQTKIFYDIMVSLKQNAINGVPLSDTFSLFKQLLLSNSLIRPQNFVPLSIQPRVYTIPQSYINRMENMQRDTSSGSRPSSRASTSRERSENDDNYTKNNNNNNNNNNDDNINNNKSNSNGGGGDDKKKKIEKEREKEKKNNNTGTSTTETPSLKTTSSSSNLINSNSTTSDSPSTTSSSIQTALPIISATSPTSPSSSKPSTQRGNHRSSLTSTTTGISLAVSGVVDGIGVDMSNSSGTPTCGMSASSLSSSSQQLQQQPSKLFTIPMVKAITDYVTNGILGHYKLYSAVFNPAVFESRKRVVTEYIHIETIIPDQYQLSDAVDLELDAQRKRDLEAKQQQIRAVTTPGNADNKSLEQDAFSIPVSSSPLETMMAEQKENEEKMAEGDVNNLVKKHLAKAREQMDRLLKENEKTLEAKVKSMEAKIKRKR